MARKKQYLDDEYSSDSASSSYSATATDLQRKRKRKRTKEDAIYGIFGSGSEGENERQGGAGRSVKGINEKGKRVDFLKGQSFVPASVNEVHDLQLISKNGSDESEDKSFSDDQSDGILSEAERVVKEPATDIEMMETRNPYGLGPNREAAEAASQSKDPGGFRPTSFVSSRGGIGSKREVDEDQISQRAGLGAATNHFPTFNRATNPGKPVTYAPSLNTATSDTLPTIAQYAIVEPSRFSETGVPNAFGAAASLTALTQKRAREQLSNNKPASFVTPPTTSIKFGGGMGGQFNPSKYLAQMGWTGGGLGRQGEGIVNPIEVKQRPERAGIAFGGIKEKTKQAKEEARRRGEEVSTDEDERERKKRNEKRSKQKSGREEGNTSQAWTRTERKPRKPKLEHRSYEEILEEHGHAAVAAAGNGQILDAAGNEFSSISAALARHAVPSNESQNLIEIRHNLMLICEGNSKDLQILAKEGSNIVEKHKWLERDRQESQRRIASEKIEVNRLQKILVLVQQVEMLGKKALSGSVNNLDSFDAVMQVISANHRDAIGEFKLDEAAVGAIVPLLRKKWSRWSPLDRPKESTEHLARWKDILCIDGKSDIMTPYETLIWNLWMPPVRSALNNNWDPYESSAAIELYQSWKPLLSPFLVDNLTQQLIIPKLSQAVNEWDLKRPLHRVIFPWMALIASQLEEVVSEAKRRVRGSLKSWKASQNVPSNLHLWKEAKVFRSNEWNSMMIDYIVPKLSSYLDTHLIIKTHAPNSKSLEVIVSWRVLLAPKIISKLLQAKFAQKFLEVLWSWLRDSRANLAEIAQWYENWKEYIGKCELLEIESVQESLQAALRLMSEAMEMGSNRSQLSMPKLRARQDDDSYSMKANTKIKISQPSQIDAEESASLTFRKIVEEAMMDADLLMQSLNRKELKSGLPLYRISRNLDGKGGVTVYLEEDVVFIERREDGIITSTFEPISIGEIVREVG